VQLVVAQRLPMMRPSGVSGHCGQALAQEMFEQEDANANAIARAAAAARPAAGGAGEPPDGPDCDRYSSKIDRKAFRAQREEFWKNEAQQNPDGYSKEDLQRMLGGKAPTGSDGYPMELHHVEGTPEGELEPMTRTDHRLGDNFLGNHPWLTR